MLKVADAAGRHGPVMQFGRSHGAAHFQPRCNHEHTAPWPEPRGARTSLRVSRRQSHSRSPLRSPPPQKERLETRQRPLVPRAFLAHVCSLGVVGLELRRLLRACRRPPRTTFRVNRIKAAELGVVAGACAVER